MRFTGAHAEILGGVMVEPGAEFDESKLDADTLKRLNAEGKVRKVTASKPSAKKGGE